MSRRPRAVRLNHSMEYVTLLFICAAALVASALTFFSGFGLGTLLMPAFAIFFPVEQAIALTAVVHFLNGLFKVFLIGKHADWRIVAWFGVPAILFSLLGAWMLQQLTGYEALHEYVLYGRWFQITPVKLVVGLLLAVFTLLELLPLFQRITFGPRVMPLGGALSGFFGGLSGHQGALRTAFLSKVGLSKEAFLGTGVIIACLIDISRLSIYSERFLAQYERLDYSLLAAAVVSAFLGSVLGNRYLKKMTLTTLQRIVAASLFVFAVALAAGLI